MSRLTLIVVTPEGNRQPLECDSVQITVADNENGKSGGSYGIRPGHIKALFALDSGTIKAVSGGSAVLTALSGPGFASVDNNTVTAVIEKFETQ